MKVKKERKPPTKVMSVLSLFGFGIMFAVTLSLAIFVWSSSVWAALVFVMLSVLILLIPAKLLKAYEFTPKKTDPETIENNEKGE